MAKKNKPAPQQPAPKKKAGLPDLEIYIDEQGRIVKNYDVADVNNFLNKHAPDKKLDEDRL